ncbi:hypothetical protein [Sorangium sp. So ce176]|uniref:hypothetical protein n=1 Tax=Sorangium sp. So ce176 TaxID=3133286 RepID=UPI003F5D613A
MRKRLNHRGTEGTEERGRGERERREGEERGRGERERRTLTPLFLFSLSLLCALCASVVQILMNQELS